MMCIIDCNLGNLRNVQKAFEKLGEQVIISSRQDDIEKADALILPGVGAFGDAMDTLRKMGLVDVIRKEVLEKKKPLLGICLGMQLLAIDGYEKGYHQGLGLLPMSVQQLQNEQNMPGFRLPHVGWNDITARADEVLFEGLPSGANFYFVHSFHVRCMDNSIIAATCRYGQEFAAAVHKDNIFATQFHPEKSQAYGFKVLLNFIKYVKSKKMENVHHA